MPVLTVPPPPAAAGGCDVTAAQAGDAEALERLLRAHLPAITAVCRRRLGRRPEAEDAIQETLERAMRSLGSLRDTARIEPWLCRIAERICLDHLRGQKRHLVALDDQELVDPVSIDELAERWDETRQLHASLERLGERPRRALWMRDALGAPVPIVAAELGVTEGSARVLLARARQQLRAQWAGAAGIIPGIWLRLQGLLAKTAEMLGEHLVTVVPAVVLAGGAAVLAPMVPAQALLPAELASRTTVTAPAAPAVPAVAPAPVTPAVAPAAAAPVAAPAPAARPEAPAAPAPAPAQQDSQPQLAASSQAPAQAPVATAETNDQGDPAVGLDVFAGNAPEILDEIGVDLP